MNFDFTDDQKHLKAEARRFLDAKCAPARVRRVLDAPKLAYDEDLWCELAGQGWLGAAIPEQYGGLALGRIELCALAEEVGRSLAPVPFASTIYYLAEALLIAGSDEQKARYLPQIAEGRLIGCAAFHERPGDLAASGITATIAGEGLSGIKIPVTDGTYADVALVLVREAEALSLALVDLKRSEVSRRPLKTIDPTRGAAELRFAQARFERIGPIGAGLEIARHIEERAAVLFAFEQIGGADRCLEMARDYALLRHAFGRPIGANQAIKHKLADMYVANELARSSAYFGASALSASSPDLAIAAASARIAASEAYWNAAKESIQIHGGVGFTWETDCHLYYRRACHLALIAGAPQVWRQRLAANLLEAA